MDLTRTEDRERWRRHLAGIVAGRKVICGLAPLAAMSDLVSLLDRAGAKRPLLLHTERGAGPVPGEDEAFLVRVEVPRYATVSEELRDQDRVLRNPSDPVRAAVDAYDPGREALWCVGPFAGTEAIDGRTVLGGREHAWAALEDKLVVDGLWDDLGVRRSPTRTVDVASSDELAAASRDLDAGDGVVWVADARDGFHGGGEFTRWVVTADERASAAAFFRDRCDRLRVMPFLEGVPCSIHGIVLPDGTAVLRPVELAILRGTRRRFVYGGQGTTWDPPGTDRDEMRDVARRTGELLRERVGYRGGFGIDGVLTVDGFRPTELNPRFSGGLMTLARSLDLELFLLLQFNLVAARDPGVAFTDLEAWTVPALDLARTVQPKAMPDRRLCDEPVELRLTWDGDRLRRDDSGELTLSVGPTSVGAFARLDAAAVVDAGDRIGPLNAALMRFLDAELGAEFGPVRAAPDVRRTAGTRSEPTPVQAASPSPAK